MKNLYQPNFECIEEILIREIVFEKNFESTSVAIFGYHIDRVENTVIIAQYCTQISELTNMLLSVGVAGETVIEAITDKLYEEEVYDPEIFVLDDDEKQPIRLDVRELLGGLLQIKNMALIIYKPMEENEQGEWVEDPDNFYLIESFKRNKYNTINLPPSNLQQELGGLFIKLEQQFNYFISLVEEKVDMEEAKQQAALNDALLFKIAVLNHGIMVGD